MLPTRNGSIRLFEFSGVEVFLHWSWFLVAAYSIGDRASEYSGLGWNVAEYLSLFLIVLLHEFGHALACRQVGGSADRIVLWPLGGVAFVSPPARPGATLWSIAAGPLVNVALLPPLAALYWLGGTWGWAQSQPDLMGLVQAVLFMNCVLLAFNLLPIYPLDGGQILQSLLWFVMGRPRSLLVATGIGFLGGASLMLLALWTASIWGAIVSGFLLFQCWKAFRVAQALIRLESAPRRETFTCPSCKKHPPSGPFWICGSCRRTFDTFETMATCPGCASVFPATRCVDCGQLASMEDWALEQPKA